MLPDLRCVEVPVPQLGKDEVLVKVRAVGFVVLIHAG